MSLATKKDRNSFAPNSRSISSNEKRYYKHFLSLMKVTRIQDQPYGKISITPKEMPFYASFKKASYTIEAAVILPLFITLMVFGMFIIRMLQVQSGVQQSLNNTSREMAVTLGNMANLGESDKDVDPSEQDPTVTGELSEAALLAATIAKAGYEMVQNKVPLEYVDGGAIGFDFTNTSVEGNYIDLQVDYQMSFPIGLLGNYTFDMSQRARTRKWIGYDKAENTIDGEYVFITEKGEAYHRNYNCTYLNPSVHKITKEELDKARNLSGGIYYECKRCKSKEQSGFLYVTDYGTAYHNDVNCTEIKHNIEKVLYLEVKDTMRPCSKCAGE